MEIPSNCIKRFSEKHGKSRGMNHRDQFIQRFLQLVEPYPYVLLKSTGELIGSIDLEVLLDKNRTEKIIPLLVTDVFVDKFKLVKQDDCWQILLYFRDDAFLQIDFIFDFFHQELRYLDTEEIKKAAVQDAQGIRFCRLPHLAEHLFLFYLLKGIPVPPHHLRLLTNLASFQQREMEKYIQQKFHLMVFHLADLAQPNAALRRKIITHLHDLPDNRFLIRIQRKTDYYWNRLTRLSPQRGMTITFSGMDNSVKSTIVGEVKETLTRKYGRKVVVLRHRPTNLLLTSFLFRHFYVYCKYHLRSYIVLYERYYFDDMVARWHAGEQWKDRLPKFLYRFSHQPDLNLFLYNQPEVLRQQAAEIPVAEVEELTDRYKALFEGLRKAQTGKPIIYLSIENKNKEATLDVIFKQYKRLV